MSTIPYPYAETKRRHEIDWRKHPAVVFESDDWGACENAIDAACSDKIAVAHKKHKGEDCRELGTLESVDDLERLYRLLEKHQGADGLPAVFTAFVCVGNPDYEAIGQSGFKEYRDIGLDEGVPPGWERGDIAGKLREGLDRGVFAPEFHANLHHTSPKLWLELLNEDSPNGRVARDLFALRCYYQGIHLPEYHKLDIREQFQWVETGVRRFKRIFGVAPTAAVTSDAFPETEIVWSLNGIKVVCLKNCRNHNGEVVVYHTKPWNMQDVYTPLGAYNELLDVVYLTRNAFFELQPPHGCPAETLLGVVDNCLNVHHEPAIISTHRVNYVSLDKEMAGRRHAELETLLAGLCKRGVSFLTTAEVGQLYRQGWSERRFGDKRVIRKWCGDAEDAVLPDGRSVASLPVGTYVD